VTTYNRPYTHDDHEAITINMVVMGKVQDGHVVYANEADKGIAVREKASGKAKK